jgi:DNA-binding transcriptional LysR family regulator
VNISALQTFLAVISTGNLNSAASRLSVSQSTVTARIDALESTLGQRLLVRSRRGTELTKAGFAFQRHAELVVEAWEQARNAVSLPKGFSGLFSFACHYDLWEGAGSVWLDNVRARYNDLAFETWCGDASDITRWLMSGLVDAALYPEPLTGTGLNSREVPRDKLVQVSTIPRKVLAWDQDYIYVDLGSEFRRQHSLAWPGDDTASMTFSSSRWALDHMLANGGSAYLPWRLAEPMVRAGGLYEVDGAPHFFRALHLIWRTASLKTYPWIPDEGF